MTRQFEIGAETQMESLFQFCRASEELIRAFWLATLCLEAIYQASIEQEEKTYGKVSCEKIGKVSMFHNVSCTYFGLLT